MSQASFKSKSLHDDHRHDNDGGEEDGRDEKDNFCLHFQLSSVILSQSLRQSFINLHRPFTPQIPKTPVGRVQLAGEKSSGRDTSRM